MKLLSALYSNLIGHAVDLPLNSVIQESADYGAYTYVIISPSFARGEKLHMCLSAKCKCHLCAIRIEVAVVFFPPFLRG